MQFRAQPSSLNGMFSDWENREQMKDNIFQTDRLTHSRQVLFILTEQGKTVPINKSEQNPAATHRLPFTEPNP